MKLLTLVHPVWYSVVDGAEHSRVGYLIVIGLFCLRSVVDIILIHVDQGIATWSPGSELQRRRFVRCQYRLRPANIIITRAPLPRLAQ